ncbi:MAG: tetratricopeptide repeat protein [Planctomycetes bacterium]|nr:tetratricopeptide repeat protein [Planctomycetota bacterium]
MTETEITSRATLPIKGRATIAIAAVAVALGGATTAAWLLMRGPSLPPGVSSELYATAEQKFRELYGRDPQPSDALSLAGELAVADGRLEAAVACFRAIPSDDAQYAAAARLQEGQLLVRLNRAFEAEQSLRDFLALAELDSSVPVEHVRAGYKWLTYLLSVELRLEERKVLLAEQHARGLVDVYDSMQYYFPHLLIWHTTTGREPLNDYLAHDLQNVVLRTALGRYHTLEGRLDEARALLDNLHRRQPRELAAAAALLECHFERSDWQAFRDVAKSLPDAAPDEPWLLTRMRGELALQEGRFEEAVRHFRAVLEDDPANPWSQMGLAEAYAGLERPGERQQALERSLGLAEIRVSLPRITESDPAAYRELAVLCDKVGMTEAAATFRQHARRIGR